ncbi:MAG TPA: radical SAM protein [Clostridiales bacterium]|nr:MAG: radical SAM protein [Clostridiales bacterium GWD2_32_59]HAN09668.1 radical SAM protein [Clostridiales bacterium]
MKNTKNVIGFKKKIFIIWVMVSVFIHSIFDMIKGKIKPSNLIRYLKRQEGFIKMVSDNKFVKIDGKTRMDLYVPGFPSKAFYNACMKFNEFDDKLPCKTVLISVTSACKYNCEHCYQKYDKGKDVNIDCLKKVVKHLSDIGIAFFNIEGGEPFLVYDRLRAVCEQVEDSAEIWINSTGEGMTLDRLKELKKLNVTAVMFSLHSSDKETFNHFFGNAGAWDTMKNGVSLCHQAGIAVAFNACLQKEDFDNGNYEAIMDLAKDLKGSIIQLIKPKPAGGWLEKGVKSITHKDIEHIKSKVNKYNLDKKYKEYPSISSQIIEEDENHFGCTAGGTDRFYINAKGDLQPCEFLNISFGNVEKENFEDIYKKMREVFKSPGTCWLCEAYSKDIYKIKEENNLVTLPLDKELSKQVYENWDRGETTKFYRD